MFGGIFEAFRIPELKKRLFFTFLILIIYRFGVFVPTPGIDAGRLKDLFQQTSSTLFGMVNMFSGGALENFSVFALGIMPYISVSIIVQLLTHSIPSMKELQKEGERGRRTLNRYTRLGTLALALPQGYFIAAGLEAQQLVAMPGMTFRLMTMITLATGTLFAMWLGEQITERGIGNGISIMIMAGIVARMPATINATFEMTSTGQLGHGHVLLLFLFGLGVIGLIVYVERCQRRIPVQYPRRMVGKQMTQAATQFLPFKLNMAGVMPPIFASTLMVFPAMIFKLSGIESLNVLSQYLTDRQGPVYEILFLALIFFFSYFWILLVSDPNEIAERLKKEGGFVPTVRPGKDTATYIEYVLNRITFWGALYIGIVCIVPTLFYTSMGAEAFIFFFGGTAVLIVVSVTLDTMSQIESYVVARNYEGFMSKGPGKMRGAGKMYSKGRLIRR